MGIANIGDVYDVWSDLPHAEMRLLLYMAKVTLDHPSTRDDTPARLYWGGNDRLVYAMGWAKKAALEVPTDDQRRNVSRLLRELRDRGALRQVAEAVGGRAARWEVVTDRPAELWKT